MAVKSVTPSEAWHAVERGEARILDLRTEAERRRYGWPPGAERVSLARHVIRPQGPGTIYLCQHANRSKLTARRGAPEIAGGWPAWEAAALPIERRQPRGAAAGQPDRSSTAAEQNDQDNGESGVDVHEAARLRESGEAIVLDVRDQKEWDAGHIPDAILVPMDEVDSRLSELPDGRRIVTVCRSGKRSGEVARELRAKGYRADNVEGGMEKWQEAGLPMEPPDGTVA